MRNLARLVAVLLLCAMARSQTISVPIEVTSEPRAIFVMAEINGHKVRLLLDTGSLVTLADPTRTGMSEHDLNQSVTITAYDAHASHAIPVVQTEVRLGDLKLRVPVLLDSNFNLPRRFGQIDGLLGMNVLAQFDSFRIDQKGRTLELSDFRK